jgi:hypothetical protein
MERDFMRTAKSIFVLAFLVISSAEAAGVNVFERDGQINIGILPDDRAGALYDALNVAIEYIPGYCNEGTCVPAIYRKHVSSGVVVFYCDRSSYDSCFLAGPYDSMLSFSFSGDAAAATSDALAVVGNPFQSSDGLAAISCNGDSTCIVRATAITEYWLDHNNLFFAEHEYGSYGRAVLYPFFVNDGAQAFYDIFDVPEQVTDELGTKVLQAGALNITCYRAIAPYFVYRYRCNLDVPMPDGPLAFPVDVASTLAGDTAASVYNALDLPGPTKEFNIGDGLITTEPVYSIICTPDKCDLRFRRPPLK